MSHLGMDDVARLVVNQRFYDPATAVAVSWAESGGNTTAVNINHDWHTFPDGHVGPSTDRGLFQINNYWHREVSEACAFDAFCNVREAYRISSGGRDWHQWNTWLHGSHVKYMTSAHAAVMRQLEPPTPPSPSWWKTLGRQGQIHPTFKAWQGPSWEIAFAQDVMQKRANQFVATSGMFDGATTQAVLNIQRFFGLRETGQLDAATWRAIEALAA